MEQELEKVNGEEQEKKQEKDEEYRSVDWRITFRMLPAGKSQKQE